MNKWKIGEHKKFMVFCYWLQNAIAILKHRISKSAQYMTLGNMEWTHEWGEKNYNEEKKERNRYVFAILIHRPD